ncbi:hypothetical protein ACSFA0_22400 [Variovorax sp. LT1P1]|uniref:hypothetical protein n=1 Tax=Variovorax sp. LT1P1 TaxID=3443730 RepID=UPI003F46E5EC
MIQTFLRMAVETQDVEWLESARSAGVFQVPMELGMDDSTGAKSTINGAPIDPVSGVHLLPLYECLFAALQQVTYEVEAGDVNVANVGFGAEMLDFVTSMISDFVVGADHLHRVREAIDAESGPTTARDTRMANAFLDGTAAGLMVLASALRLPKAVAALGRACPNAMDAELDPARFMRDDVAAAFQSVREVPEDEEDKYKRSCRFKPAVFAMHFGAGDCVDALVASGWNPRGPLGSWYNPGPEMLEQIPVDDPWRTFNRGTSKTGLTLVDILIMQSEEQIAPFAPDVLFTALERTKQHGDFRRVDQLAYLSIGRDWLTYGGTSTLYALMKAGAFDLDVAQSLQDAADQAFGPLFDHYRDRMPWSELFDADYDRSIVHEILASEVARQQPELCEELALKVIGMATEDGYAAKVFAPRITDLHIDTVEPAIAVNAIRVVEAFLDGGYDMCAQVGDHASTPLELMEAAGATEMEELVRAHKARAHVKSLLDRAAQRTAAV